MFPVTINEGDDMTYKIYLGEAKGESEHYIILAGPDGSCTLVSHVPTPEELAEFLDRERPFEPGKPRQLLFALHHLKRRMKTVKVREITV